MPEPKLESSSRADRQLVLKGALLAAAACGSGAILSSAARALANSLQSWLGSCGAEGSVQAAVALLLAIPRA